MKQLFSFVFLVFCAINTHAQMPGQFGQDDDDENPVTWSGKVEKKSDDSYDLIFEADIKPEWHIFSQHTGDGGGLPLEIEFHDDSTGYETNGEAEESETIEQFSEIFEVDEEIFEDKAVLTQNITVKDDDLRYVKAELAYQVCQEVCINEEQYFVFDIEEEEVEFFENYDDFEDFDTGSSKETAESSSSTSNSSTANNAVGGMSFLDGDDDDSPVDWSGELKKDGSDNYDLIFKAQIEDGWHIFSQHTGEGGGLPLEVEFHNESDDFEANGAVEESETIEQFSDIFEVNEEIFEKEAVLTQNITLKNDDARYVKAEVRYQVCEEVCINEEQYFAFDLKNESVKVFDNYDDFEAVGNEDALDDPLADEGEMAQAEDTNSSASGESQGMWTTFILAFLWGFAALLTPCVFPMIPMTVSFFTKQSKTKALGKRNAILYSLFIIVIYVILGTLIVGVFGADSLNRLSTSVTFNIVFFLLLVVFAASFFGAFEIVLPSSWANKVDKQADRGGIIGIFFMALALAIVSFSCTGPIIGTLLVQSASQGGFAPIIGMLGFSLALAIPFGLFALFPSWMNSMPKSGGWLNSVKVVIGFIELALAFKFLSNADLVLQAQLLPREIFLAIWIAIFGVMAFYLFGKIQLPNDNKPEHISVGRLGMGLLTLSFTIYLIPGMWGAPLKMLSGYLPPENYSESPFGIGYSEPNTNQGGSSDDGMPDTAIPGPQNIKSFRDYEEGLAYAKEVGKPIMLDFTGMACVNCRKMEDRVWSEPQVKSIIKDDVVLISLYVDIDEKLPEDEQYTSETTGRRIRTVGNKWSDFQIEHYQMNAQPYYVLVDPETEENLNDPVAYMPDADKYESWLLDGIGNYSNDQEDVSSELSASGN